MPARITSTCTSLLPPGVRVLRLRDGGWPARRHPALRRRPPGRARPAPGSAASCAPSTSAAARRRCCPPRGSRASSAPPWTDGAARPARGGHAGGQSERARDAGLGGRCARAGVTRISLGVQSLRDAELVALARGHTADEARQAYAAARAAGFDNVSIDLIYGIPGQSLDDWRANAAGGALELGARSSEPVCPSAGARPRRVGGAAAPGRAALAERLGRDARTTAWRRPVPARRGAARRPPGTGTTSSARGRCPGRERRATTPRTGRAARIPASGAGAHSYDGAARALVERSRPRRLPARRRGRGAALGRQ